MLKGIIALCAPSPGGSNDHIALIANRFSRQLASEEVATLLVGYMLDDLIKEDASSTAKPSGSSASDTVKSNSPTTEESLNLDPSITNAVEDEDDDAHSVSSRSSISSSSSHSEYHSIISSPSERSTSSLIHVASVIIELMRKNNSDFFEPYLFHTIRQRLIEIQQQYLAQFDRPGMDTEQRAEYDRVVLERSMEDMTNEMGIVHFGPLLVALSLRLPDFQALLAHPRSLVRVLTTRS